jgi:hypothetical protein
MACKFHKKLALSNPSSTDIAIAVPLSATGLNLAAFTKNRTQMLLYSI